MLNFDIFSIINAKGMPSLCNLKLQQYSILYIQTLHNDCSHIEDVHLLFCAHFIIFTCLALAKAGLVVGPLGPSVRSFVRPSVRNTFRVPSLCNL